VVPVFSLLVRSEELLFPLHASPYLGEAFYFSLTFEVLGGLFFCFYALATNYAFFHGRSSDCHPNSFLLI